MTLDLSEIVQRPGMASRVTVDQECLDDPEIICLEPLEGRVDFRNAGDLLMIDGDVATTVELVCARCLEPVSWPTVIHLEELFPLADVIRPPREPAEGEEFDNTVSSVVHLEAGKPILDLDELMRQQLLTQVPMQALCHEACKGLCPRCGANLNEGPCGCPADEADSPLAGLSTLLEDDRNGNDSRQ